MAYTWDNRVAFVVRFLYDIDNNGFLDARDFQCLALRSCVLEGKGDCSPARLQKYQHIMMSLWEEIAQLADFDKVPDYVGTLYLFGGWNGTEDLDDLWSYDTTAERWTLLCEHSGQVGGPSPRSCHKMVFDPVHRRLFTLGRYLDNAQRVPANMNDGMISVEEFKVAVKNSCVGKKYEDFPQAMKAFIESNFRMIDIDSDGVIGVNEYRYDCVQRMVVEDIKVIDDAYETLLNDDDRKKGGLTIARYQELFAQFLGDESETCQAKHLFGPLEL